MFGRRHKTRQELVRSEFGDSVNHFRQAAVHAAGGIGATVGPMSGKAKTRMTSTRGMVGPTAGRLSKSVSTRASSSWDTTVAAVAPLAQAARDGAARANALDAMTVKKTRKVIETETTEGHATRSVMTLIACGAAVGAAGALVARRRNRAKWAEYEPESLEADAASLLDADQTATTSISGMGDSGMIKKATDMTKSAVGTVRHKIHDATADRDGPDLDTSRMPNDVADDARNSMKHASDKANEGASHFTGSPEGKPSSG